MSKSIGDYKKAMDNVRISDSFYERTERMLKESGSEKITVKSKRNGIKYIAFGSMAAVAACAVIAFMSQPAQNEDEIAETVVTSVTEISPANEAIYIDLEEDGVIYTISPAVIPETAEDNTAETHAMDEETAEEAADIPAETAAEIRVTEIEVTVTEPAAAEYDAPDDIVERLYGIGLENKEAELTSYLGAGLKGEKGDFSEEGGVYQAPAPSGINFLILDENSAAEVVEMTAAAISSAPEAPVKNIRSPEFVVEINDFSTGRTELMISINDDGTVSAAYFEGEDTVSKVYAVHREDFNRLEKVLFLKFGSVSQYEDFIA